MLDIPDFMAPVGILAMEPHGLGLWLPAKSLLS
jgi:hypothetical protein